MMVIFLVGLVSMILMRTLRKDYARYSKEDDIDEMVTKLDDLQYNLKWIMEYITVNWYISISCYRLFFSNKSDFNYSLLWCTHLFYGCLDEVMVNILEIDFQMIDIVWVLDVINQFIINVEA